MRGAAALALVVATGCNQAFRLDETILVDADLKQNHTCEEKMVQNRDEDGDGEPNGTDNCPTLYNISQPDRDADGVGDACDPHPDVPGDSILDVTYFDSSLGCWVPNDIAFWTLGESTATTTTNGTSIVQSPLTASITLDVAFTATEPPTDESLELRLDQPDSPLECSLGLQVQRYSYIRLGLGAGTVTNGPLGASLHHVTVSRTPTATTCTLEQASSTSPLATELSTGAPITAAIRFDTTHITLTSATLYASP